MNFGVIIRFYCWFFSFCVFAQPNDQPGLEGIFVEKFYIAGKEDLVSNSYAGELKQHSVTYRIYVDLLPRYRFQAAYGSKEHPLFFRTTTSFYNNTDKGGVVASIIPRRSIGRNTVLLDSWLSVGTAGELCLGVPKEDDDAADFVEFEESFLRNHSKDIGYPIRERDGMKYSLDMPLHTFFGLDSAIQVFGYKGGKEFYLDNGAWACMGKGSLGVDSLSRNRILIAQLTTDGKLEFELNLQIATPEGKIQRFVARNPKENEYVNESLILFQDKK
jgi:hypothetical protein